MNATTPHPRLRALAVAAVQHLQTHGFLAFWAGGCVRDILLDRTPKDYDIVTNATPEQTLRLFPKAVAVGQAFGVVRATIEDAVFEIATFRQDHGYEDGRHPSHVTYASPEADSARRDFTINAMFFDPVAETLHDYHAGQRDLRDRLIRCVSDPDTCFREDHLRLLRAVRFASTLHFSIHPQTAAAIPPHAASLTRISAERVRDELTRLLLEAASPGDAVASLQELGILPVILHEISAMRGQAQPPEFHPEGDVFQHTILMLNLMRTSPRPVHSVSGIADAPPHLLAFAVLLHDVGKPVTARVAPERIRFDRHAEEGATLASAILRRLRFPNAEIETIEHCVRNHMTFMNVPHMKPATLRRLIGSPAFPIELELHRLDCLASHRDLANYDFLLAFRKRLADEPPLPQPWISGRDILALGIPQGPDVGFWRKTAYEAQLEGQCHDRESLLLWLQQRLAASRAADVPPDTDTPDRVAHR